MPLGQAERRLRFAGCHSETNRQTSRSRTNHTTGDPVVVVAAGDIASCASKGDEATANLLDRTHGTVLTLGDNAYPDGTAADFRECYHPSWGKHKARTKPAPGNHDYSIGKTAIGRAKGYFGYFGKAAGDRGKCYYSYNRGRWHLVSLNSNCAEVGRCYRSSRQIRWLKANLAANDDKRCTLAYMHHPRFNSGKEHGSTPEVKPLWDVLYAAGVDVVLSGHEHNSTSASRRRAHADERTPSAASESSWWAPEAGATTRSWTPSRTARLTTTTPTAS
jgi:hypothetical protein